MFYLIVFILMTTTALAQEVKVIEGKTYQEVSLEERKVRIEALKSEIADCRQLIEISDSLIKREYGIIDAAKKDGALTDIEVPEEYKPE